MLLFDWILIECASIFNMGIGVPRNLTPSPVMVFTCRSMYQYVNYWQFRNTIQGTGQSLYATKLTAGFIKHSILIVLDELGHPLSFPHFIMNDDKKCSLMTEIKKYTRKINVMCDTFIFKTKAILHNSISQTKTCSGTVHVHIMQSSLYTLQLEMEMLTDYIIINLHTQCCTASNNTQFLHNSSIT